MKPEYRPLSMMWEVKGLGVYATWEKACEAIAKHKAEQRARKGQRVKQSSHVSCCLSEDVENRLQEMAKNHGMTLSAMVRKLIEKGVSDYEADRAKTHPASAKS